MHAEGVKVGVEKVKDFKRALEIEGYRRNNIPKNIPYPQRLFYSDWVKYAEQLLRFLSLFPKEQVKVILYEEFRGNNQKTVDEVCEFLNIQKISIHKKTANVRMQPRFPVVTRFLYQSYVMFYALVLNRFGQKSLPVRLSKSMGDFLRKISLKETNKTWTDPALEAKLRRQFKAEVIKFNHLLHEYSLVDTDLITFWGYDKA